MRFQARYTIVFSGWYYYGFPQGPPEVVRA